MEGEKDPLALPLDPEDPGASQELRYGLDLFNHRYYWESHVYFEALWNAHERRGESADFFKALIKLAAAGVKKDLGQRKELLEHYHRAQELLLGILTSQKEIFLGFELKEILSQIESALKDQDFIIEIHPLWE